MLRDLDAPGTGLRDGEWVASSSALRGRPPRSRPVEGCPTQKLGLGGMSPYDAPPAMNSPAMRNSAPEIDVICEVEGTDNNEVNENVEDDDEQDADDVDDDEEGCEEDVLGVDSRRLAPVVVPVIWETLHMDCGGE